MRRDDSYLLDMLLACRAVLEYVDGVTWDAFQKSRMLQDAVVRQVQVIGEAARSVSPEFRDSHPDIPWRGIIGMRHELVHHYFGIDLALVWLAATRHVPDLAVQIEPLVPPQSLDADQESAPK